MMSWFRLAGKRGVDMYRGSGIHHVGIGVENLEAMKTFYQGALEFNRVFVEFPEEEHNMDEMFRMPYVKFSGIMFQQEAGGVTVELIQMANPVPRPIRKDFRYGDIGVAKITTAVSDVEQLHRELKDKVNFCAEPKSTAIPGWGDYHFVYGRDPEGNLIEFISSPELPVENKFGGARWIGVSVTDLERSRAFYQKYLGFDTVVINPHDSFSGLVDEVSVGSGTQVRSCVISNSKGGEMLELFEVLKPRGRSIPLSTYWGDFGYLEIAIQCDDIHEMGSYFEKEGMEFLARPTLALDEPDYEGWYLYIKDPDGIPVEVISLVPKQ